MKLMQVVYLSSLTLLASCATSIDGLYEPACIAFAGDRIALKDGRFEWQRYTDQVNVDDDGNVIDPFPGYPISGVYEFDNDQLMLTPDNAGETIERYILEYREALYMLSYDENEAVLDGENMPTCALKRSNEFE